MPRVRRPYEEDEHEAAEPRAARRPGAAAAVLDLQRGYGNHAVTRMLARNPNPALERNPTIRPPKPPLKSGRDVDAIFDSSPFFKDLVGAKLKKLPLAKAMKLDAEPQFEAAWIEYAMRSYNPETQQKFTLEEAKAFVEAKGLRAFQDEDRGTVHIRKARADLRTQLHEGLHLFCDDRWKDRMGMSYNANEGLTQYFTRKLGDELGRGRGRRRLLPRGPRRPEGEGRRPRQGGVQAVAGPAVVERLQRGQQADAVMRVTAAVPP
jgi:hypothetical protein